MAAMLDINPVSSTVNFIATPHHVAVAAVERAKRSGRRPQAFYLLVLEAHAAANAAWYAEQEARRLAKRRANGGAHGDHSRGSPAAYAAKKAVKAEESRQLRDSMRGASSGGGSKKGRR